MDNKGKFYENHKHKLFSYLMRMTGDYHLSSDIMQETFIRYFKHYDQKDTPSLLYTIARNTFYDYLRKQKGSALIEEIQNEGQSDQDRILLVREEYRQALLAIQKLEDDEKNILSLAISSDFSYREIAEITGISEANVKVKVHRARQKLKKMLEENIHE